MARPSDPNARLELLEAAEQVFIEAGLDHARVEDITQRAGRSKGSFYLHFESKEDAFRTIVESLLSRLGECIVEPPAAPIRDAEEAKGLIGTLLEKDLEIFEFLWQNRRLCSLLLSGGGSARFGYLIDAFAEGARAATRKWLLWGVEQGLYHPELDVELASFMISGSYDQAARQLVRASHKPDLRAWLIGMQTMILRGIGGPAAALALNAVGSELRTAARRRPRVRRAPAKSVLRRG